MNILLGMSGSVACVLAGKLVAALQKIGTVRVVVTGNATHFFQTSDIPKNVQVYNEFDEWQWDKISDPILHIALRDWADALIIAPISANTVGKIANGLCDNLLTSIAMAWDFNKPFIVAPACNTKMWANPFQQRNIKMLRDNDIKVVNPVVKDLACGDHGIGAMADINMIVGAVKRAVTWHFPLFCNCPGIPVGNHPGAFGARRKHDVHCGVDLYCSKNDPVFAVENGTIVAIEPFTGPKAGYPWWEDTEVVRVEGASGVVCYGEIIPCAYLRVGDSVKKGDWIGNVTPVLPKGKERPDIPGHSRWMVHMQLLTHGSAHKDKNWDLDGDKPDNLLDPTQLLLNANVYAPNSFISKSPLDIEKK